MNERFKELAVQAGLFSARPKGGKTRVLLAYHPSTNGEIADPDQQLEKFAELIIQECADILKEQAHQYDLMVGREVSAQTMETAASLIQVHFGVEE